MELQRNMRVQWNAWVHRGMYGRKRGHESIGVDDSTGGYMGIQEGTWEYRGWVYGSKGINESIGGT